ncbi:MAG TPA: signal peptide peptidase SppA [Sedimentisphaerales bacterium]|nr:signal peptide peptidase SppA [Sedimentisphaerales bacterium]
MDFDQGNNISGPPPQPAGPLPGFSTSPPPARPRASGWRIFLSILLVLSVIANIAMFLMLIGVVAVFATGQRSLLSEEVVREGSGTNKIAMVTVQGIIQGELANDVHRQLKAAREDRRVKGVIIRVNSPGGTISASDQIYKEIRKYREEAKKPVVAFMQGVAASGGYYASVACDKIVAEPTAMTGSIGVISWWLVVQELLEDKLGVLPVTITSGQKKDWPSSFREPAPEELDYMRDKLITPAYERFVEIVAEGRKETLSPEEVRQLSDGSIYGAQEALEVKLIDEIGYLDKAISMVKSMAGIDEAGVVEYRKPFSLTDFLSYRSASLPKLDRNTLYELGTPQVLYLWSAY